MNLESSKPAIFMEEKFEGEGLFILHFPDVCLSCGRSFQNSKDFLENTFLLPQETYFDANTNNVVDHRNCGCGETLILRRKNRRDQTKKGNQKRQAFQNQLIFLAKNGVPIERARTILMRGKKNNR
tara:strand:- start:633 stop:1010 length:378 start_codon:yes stop_codon:yes gene_type:complete